MTLSKEFVPEALTADTHMTSTPSSMTRATPATATILHSFATTTASKSQVPTNALLQLSCNQHLEDPDGLFFSTFIFLCLCRGRCARGTACRYSHDFSALTAASPLMPALTAAAAAAAIAQISLHPGGLLPQLAPFLQPYPPSTSQQTTLQQQLLQDHGHSSSLPPQAFPFGKAAFPPANILR